MPTDAQKHDLGPIFDFPMIPQKGLLAQHFRSKKFPASTSNIPGTRPGADLAFHETTVITVPFGPSGFLKVLFSMENYSISIFSAFICAMLYLTLLSSFFIIPQ